MLYLVIMFVNILIEMCFIVFNIIIFHPKHIRLISGYSMFFFVVFCCCCFCCFFYMGFVLSFKVDET